MDHRLLEAWTSSEPRDFVTAGVEKLLSPSHISRSCHHRGGLGGLHRGSVILWPSPRSSDALCTGMSNLRGAAIPNNNATRKGNRQDARES